QHRLGHALGALRDATTRAAATRHFLIDPTNMALGSRAQTREIDMIYVTKEVAVNAAGHPRLHRSDVWKGLVMKAENALPFVPGMAKCDVIERTANGLTRDIMFRGENARERITFYPEAKVVFVRESGNVDGFIVNEVLGSHDDLRLRFSFAL